MRPYLRSIPSQIYITEGQTLILSCLRGVEIGVTPWPTLGKGTPSGLREHPHCVRQGKVVFHSRSLKFKYDVTSQLASPRAPISLSLFRPHSVKSSKSYGLAYGILLVRTILNLSLCARLGTIGHYKVSMNEIS